MAISRRRQRRLVTESDPWVQRYLKEPAFARDPVEKPRVLYQGEPGAYAEEATVRFFGEATHRENRAKWEQVLESLKNGEADYGVLPIENSSTGSINQVYDLLANEMLAKGVAIEYKPKSGGASAPSPAFVRLQDVSKELARLIDRSRGRPNKDLAKLADQLRTIIEKWES